jgi:hypothetical protein
LISECIDFNKSQSQTVWCKIIHKKNSNKGVVIGVCYKSPAADEKELRELSSVIQKASNGTALIMGDFNYPRINWNTYESEVTA